MQAKTLDEMLEGFDASVGGQLSSMNTACTVTIRVSPELKSRYDQLQIKTGKRLSKKAREILLALVEAVEARFA